MVAWFRRVRVAVVGLVAVLITLSSCGAAVSARSGPLNADRSGVGRTGASATPAIATCPVTPYDAEARAPATDYTTTWYGTGGLWAAPAPYYQGQWFAGPAGMKIQWRVGGDPFTISGHRLDAPAPGLQTEIPSAASVLRSTRLIFPTPGCWQVVARIPGQELRFVVYVHPADENPVNAPSATDPAEWARLQRPLRLPTQAAGAACPIAPAARVARIAGVVRGAGPVYLAGVNASGTVTYDPAVTVNGLASQVLSWIARPDEVGSLLIRGHQLAGPNVLRFGAGKPLDAFQIDGEHGTATPDWRIGKLVVLIPAPGCYALQVDGRNFSEVIVFAAAPVRPAP